MNCVCAAAPVFFALISWSMLFGCVLWSVSRFNMIIIFCASSKCCIMMHSIGQGARANRTMERTELDQGIVLSAGALNCTYGIHALRLTCLQKKCDFFAVFDSLLDWQSHRSRAKASFFSCCTSPCSYCRGIILAI